MAENDALCICGHPKSKHGEWIGDCYGRVTDGNGEWVYCGCKGFEEA